MSSGKSSQRYSVTIVIKTDLIKNLAKECNLCCSWGFYIGNSTEPTYNVVGWASGEKLFNPDRNRVLKLMKTFTHELQSIGRKNFKHRSRIVD